MNCEPCVNFSFLGDISLNDNYIELYKKGINPFENVESLLSSSDFVVGNLECMAKGGKGENELKQPRLTTTVETLNYLKNINFKIACLAQNHVYDHLEEGFIKTTKFLSDNDIKYFGASLAKDKIELPIILEKNNVRIGLLNYVTHDTNPNLPPNAAVFVNYFELNKAISDIQSLKSNVDHVVLILHWGGRVEGGLYPDWDQPKIAYQLIDAGADLIIGHHSHTLQPFEVYKGKYIFYSLGNFCFADYVFEGKLNPMPLRRNISTVISVFFEKNKYKIDFNFFINQKTSFLKINYLPRLEFRNTLFKMLFKSIYLWRIYFFYKRRILPFVIFIKREDLTVSRKASRLFNSLKKRLK